MTAHASSSPSAARGALSPAIRRRALALTPAVLFALALGLRVWGSFLGLPRTYLPDEPNKVRGALALGNRGLRVPPVHPGFLPNTLHLVFRATAPFVPALANLSLPGGYSLRGGSPIAPQLWIARLWLDALSSLTVVLAFYLTRRVWGVGAAAAAALLLALNPLAIAAANYVKEDTPLTLWFTATALLGVRLIDSGGRLDALLAGVAAGACFGSKFSGALAGGLAVLAAVLAATPGRARRARPASPPRRGTSEHGTAARAAAHFGLVLGGFAIGFLAATPSFVLQAPALLSGMALQLRYVMTGHHDGIALTLGDTHGVFYLQRALLPAFGPLTLVAAALGTVVLLRRNRRQALLLLVWALGYTAMMEALPAKPYPFFARYVLPAVPALCALAGVGAARLGTAARNARLSIPIRVTAAAALVAVLGVPAWRTAAFVRGMYPDTREVAARWLRENLPPGSLLFVTAYGPQLQRPPFLVRPLSRLAIAAQRLASDSSAIHILLSDFAVNRFFENPEDNPEQSARYSWILGQTDEVRCFATDAPRFGFHNPTLRLLRPRAPSR